MALGGHVTMAIFHSIPWLIIFLIAFIGICILAGVQLRRSIFYKPQKHGELCDVISDLTPGERKAIIVGCVLLGLSILAAAIGGIIELMQ